MNPLRQLSTAADMFFYGLHSFPHDWIVNVDEDAFCFGPERLLALIEHMRVNEYHFAGLPDGGALPIRRHNPVVPNAFFNVFNMRAIRPAFDVEEVIETAWDDSFSRFVPAFATGPAAFDEFEPYYRYFFWLLKRGFKPLYLTGETWTDGVATVLNDHTGAPFLIHAWYAREFHNNPGRFLEIAKYAVDCMANPAAV